jgi:hypothetical protein
MNKSSNRAEEVFMTLQIALTKQVVALLLVPLLVLAMVPSRGFTQAPPPTGNQVWPREFQSGSTTFTVYQPQVESWKARDLSGRAAVSVKDAISPEEQFGVIWFTAKTNVNRAENLVTLDDITITKGNFPATPDKADQYYRHYERARHSRWATFRSTI